MSTCRSAATHRLGRQSRLRLGLGLGSAVAELPDGDRIRTFDAYRARVLALADAI